MDAPSRDRPITIAMLALGGQGGGVLTKWLVDTAEANGFLAQSTYVAGVAQRTGATVYCVELYSKDKAGDTGPPVFTPYPVPGDVDLVIAGEMAETGRAIQKGFVTPNMTTLIASSHRVYSITEKEAMGNGILDQSPVARIAAEAARKFICFDMQDAAETSGSIISAVMLGAIAATGALPFDQAAYETTIRNTGRAVEANLAGFAAGLRAVSGETTEQPQTDVSRAAPEGKIGASLASRIEQELPPRVADIALHGALRALDYQDQRYADDYFATVCDVYEKDLASGGEARGFPLAREVARQLALQMCYEDTIRVAELKTRPARMQRIRDQVAATESQPVHIVEYFHPRIEEICDTLPARVGRYVMNSPRLRRWLTPLFAKGRNIRTSTITGFLMLRSVAKIKRWRRGTLRFSIQRKRIEDWLRQIEVALPDSYDYALAVAECIEMVKGYGDTYERGLTRYQETVAIAAATSVTDKASVVRRLRVAAEGDEKGRLFEQAKAELETAA